MMIASRPADGLGGGRMDADAAARARRARMTRPSRCPASTSTSPRADGAVADRRRRASTRSVLIGQTWPLQPSSRRRPSTAARKSPLYCSIIDSSRLPPVCPARRRVLERRQARQQDAPRLGFVARQRQRALEHVARRQHAELVAQHAAAAAAVEHRDDGVEPQPRVALEAAQQAGQPGAAAEAADVQLAELHAPGILVRRRPRAGRRLARARRAVASAKAGIL